MQGRTAKRGYICTTGWDTIAITTKLQNITSHPNTPQK